MQCDEACCRLVNPGASRWYQPQHSRETSHNRASMASIPLVTPAEVDYCCRLLLVLLLS